MSEKNFLKDFNDLLEIQSNTWNGPEISKKLV